VGGATGLQHWDNKLFLVSIHAPRGGRDLGNVKDIYSDVYVSIHAPRGGRDLQDPQWRPRYKWFQSTRPVEGRTVNLTITTVS